MTPARPDWFAAPRYATPRTPSRPSYGAAIGQVAAALGRPLQPWQQLVADVATEVMPDGSWAYRTVVVHVQRRAGKTDLLGPVNLHRILIKPEAFCWLTAQRREDARDIWNEVSGHVRRSPLAQLIEVRRSNGGERLTSSTGSTFRVFTPDGESLHGKASEAVSVDEGWTLDAAEGVELEQAYRPTFATTGGQLWLPSTAGTAASTWYRRQVDRGRAAVEAGATARIAHFEWSLSPAEAERVTELVRRLQELPEGHQEREAMLDQVVQLVLSRHPGQYVRPDVVRDEAQEMAPGEFLRAYGNVWTLTSDAVIADHAWAACRLKALPAPEPGAVMLAFAVPLDRSSSSIGAAWHHAGRRAVDVVDERPGTSWLVQRCEQLAERLRCDTVSCDGAGPALDLADQLERRRKVKVRRLTTPEYLTACAGYLADVDTAQLWHRDNELLNAAVANAARRELGDRWVWSRRHSAGSIAGVESTTVARYVLDHQPPPMPAPQLHLGPPQQAGSAAPRVLTL